VRELMAQLGYRTLAEMVGHSERLEVSKAVEHYHKVRGLDFAPIFYRPDVAPTVGWHCTQPQDHGLDQALDRTTLIPLCKPALEKGQKVEATPPIRKTNRVAGTMLGA